ncbi:hypothetical protein H1R20_g5055, partial [Candolleomyces eurysporus]
MRGSGPWSCTITLRFQYDDKGTPLSLSREVPFPTIYDPKDVELWLRRAQAAILTPQARPQEFHNKSREEIKGLQTVMLPFSWNKVEVLIRDPDGADLSFVDLPGIIQHHSTDTEVIPFVKKLTELYIKNKNTLIVVTVPMTDDFENQGAFELATQADPKGLRTIGVGTKPDMLTPGNTSSLDKWKLILEGTSSNLRHGYYCVKLPTDKDREAGHSRSELEALEKTFHRTTEPWKSLDDQSRLGMRNFVENTSRLLIGLIENNLPDIKKRVDTILDTDKKLLSRLPAPFTVSNPISVILLRVAAFCKALQGTITGTQKKDFIHKNQARYEVFKNEIKKTTPNLQWSGTRPAPAVPSVPSVPASSVTKPAPLSPIYVADVQETVRAHRTWELPGYVPFEATKDIILQHIEHWEDPLTRCFNDISKNTLDLIRSLVREPEYFGRFFRLLSFVETVIKQEETALRAKVTEMLKKKFNMENGSPLRTENLDRFNQDRSTWLSQIYGNNQTPSDEHRVMADIHAYFQIASARFIDVVVLCIEEEWHSKLAMRLEECLIEKIPPLSRERLDGLLGEDPHISRQRTHLNQRITQLTKIKTRLAEYRTSGPDLGFLWIAPSPVIGQQRPGKERRKGGKKN